MENEGQSTIKKGEGLILVVDDEDILRQALETMLKICGYTTVSAKNGEEAIDVFTQRHAEIDGVLLDMIMPRLTGEEVFFKLREIDPEVKVVLASGYKQDAGVDRLIEQGLKGFVQKPYDMESISELAFKFLSK